MFGHMALLLLLHSSSFLCNLQQRDQEEPSGTSERESERLTHSEVWSREGVAGAAVLADDGGGVALLAVVVASASHAGQLADGGREDHLDPPRVVANCAPKHDTSQQQSSEERLSCFSSSPIHRSKEKNSKKKKKTLRPRRLVKAVAKKNDF